MTQSQRAGALKEAIRAAQECGECGCASDGSADSDFGAAQPAANQRKKLLAAIPAKSHISKFFHATPAV
jgi:hypothetical protein